jgi:hypothetical protein
MRNRAISQSSLIAIVFTAAGFLSILPMQAQNAARNVNPATTPDSADPSGYTSPAAPTVATASSTPASTTPTWHETAVPADKEITTKVINGVLTVDGLVAKVQLNYEIHHAGYLYIFVPGVGTAVVSRVQTYGSTKVLNAFHGSDLAFSVGGHNFELASQSPMVAAKEDAYVRLDTATVALDRMPMIGFGSTTRAPYAWPLSGPAAKDTQAHFVQPPPMPANLLPRMMSAPGQTAAATNTQMKQ